MRQPNNILEHQYNLRTYKKVARKALDSARLADYSANGNIDPIWVTGMFRSGTSLLTRLLMQADGVDLGPESDLLQARGKRKVLNPDGFFENYLFMEWSMYVFEKLKRFGNDPPTREEVRGFDPAAFDYDEFIHHAIVNIHDDRISNKDKGRILAAYSVLNMHDYLSDRFEGRPLVKNPHFAVMPDLLLKQWPASTFVAIFREPGAAVRSAEKVAGPFATVELYDKYYEQMLQIDGTVFVSYELLIADPQRVLAELQKALGLTGTIDHSMIRKGDGVTDTTVATKFYDRLMERAI